jgi:16S rRNA (cytidine1402-2'-O)-methyltransferase
MPGTLFVVATPIGNLEDLTFRAVRTLREVDLIAAEDTRRTVKLLAHCEIRKPMVSLREHNEYREAPRLVARLERGENIALVSDAGTPGIADPGARLVRAARKAGILAVPIPGPSAITAALSVSGIETPEFVFMGFPPAKGSDRTRWLERLRAEPRAVVAFEAPHRISITISDISSLSVKRPIIVLHEISKLNYSLVEWDNNVHEVDITPLGEFAIVVAPAITAGVPDSTAAVAFELFCHMTESCSVNEASASAAVSRALDIHPDVVGKAIRVGRKLAKRQKMAGP